MGKPEVVAVGKGQAVGTRDTHAARLRVQARRERPEGVDPAADPVLRLEHDRPMTLALQLIRRDQTGQATPDDHHVPAWRGARLEAQRGRGQHVQGDGWCDVRVGLPGHGIHGRHRTEGPTAGYPCDGHGR